MKCGADHTPGQREFTRIPEGPNSFAMVRMKIITAPLEQACADVPGRYQTGKLNQALDTSRGPSQPCPVLSGRDRLLFPLKSPQPVPTSHYPAGLIQYPDGKNHC